MDGCKLHRFGGVETARQGNAIGIVGMALAVTSVYVWFALEDEESRSSSEAARWILVAAIAPGTALGVLMASRVRVIE
jgi:NAD/NADP transhydrogenase beta subunit